MVAPVATIARGVPAGKTPIVIHEVFEDILDLSGRRIIADVAQKVRHFAASANKPAHINSETRASGSFAVCLAVEVIVATYSVGLPHVLVVAAECLYGAIYSIRIPRYIRCRMINIGLALSGDRCYGRHTRHTESVDIDRAQRI